MKIHRRIVIAFAALVVAGNSFAAFSPYQLRDINTNSYGCEPAELVEMGGVVYFRASRIDVGEELWRSDGTAAGTYLVADIAPGASGSKLNGLAAVGTLLFFFADDISFYGESLWASDGTAAGTRRVSELEPGLPQPVRSSPIVDVGGIAYFLASDFSLGDASLYRSDGTEAGTWSLGRVIAEGYWIMEPLVTVNGRLFFAGFDPATGWEPWVSDGTPGGTHILRDLRSGPADSMRWTGKDDFAVAAGRVIFAANDGWNGREPWVSDGTDAGTRLVKDMLPGAGSGMLEYLWPQFGSFRGEFVFEAVDALGTALWTSDGTALGTTAILRNLPSQGTRAQLFQEEGGLLYYIASAGSGTTVWRSDGTGPGTYSLGIGPGTALTKGKGIVSIVGAGVILSGGDRLWRSDGTVAGTVSICNPGSGCPGNPSEMIGAGARVFLAGNARSWHAELWVSDGTTAGTAIPLRINGANNEGVGFDSAATLRGNEICFLLDRNGLNSQSPLWCSDGTVGGTREIALPCRISFGCESYGLQSLPDRLFFSYDEGANQGWEPWVSDGTPPGTFNLGDLCPGAGSLGTRGVLGSLGNLALFSAGCGQPSQLWRTDGTSAGTWAVEDVGSNGIGSGGELNGRYYFDGIAGANGLELWETDGTAPGTSELVDINVGASHSNPTGFAQLSGRLFFGADDGIGGRELWETDGTASGTRLAFDLCPGACSGLSSALYGFGDWMFFYGFNGSAWSFFRSDGTEAGTSRLGPDIAKLAIYQLPPVMSGGWLYFVVSGTGRLNQLWRTDGTALGTALVAANLVDQYSARLLAAGGRVWYYASDSVQGEELWSSDGTPSGSQIVADLWPGLNALSHSQSVLLRATSTHLVFAASDGLTGLEPWAIELPRGVELLRNAGASDLDPLTPPRSALLPLDATRDSYLANFGSGEVDPELGVLSDSARPLVFYSIAGSGSLKLAKTPLRHVRIEY